MIPQSTLYPRDVSTYGSERVRSLVGLISLPNTQGVLCLQAPDGNEFYIFQDGNFPSFGGVNEVMAGGIGAVGCHIGASVVPTIPSTSLRDGLTIIGSRRVSSSLAIAGNPVSGLSGALGMQTGYGNIAAFLYLLNTAANTWQLTLGTEAQFLAKAGGTPVGTPVVGSGNISPTQITLPFHRHEGRTIIGGNQGNDKRLPGVMFIESGGRGAGMAFEYGAGDEMTAPLVDPAVIMYFPDAVSVPLFVTPDAWVTWNAGLLITTASLPGATHAVAYVPVQLTAQGGSAPYVWTVTVGTLPVGMVLSPDGIISGTPTTAGTSNFTVQVAAGAPTTTKALSIVVA